jgi:putative intracellular protease/amidase
MNILIVLTSHDRLGDTGKKTGFWLEELAAPYYVFKDAGSKIALASPKGGQPPLDPRSDEPTAQTAATARFKADQSAQNALADTTKLSDISASRYDAVLSGRSRAIVGSLRGSKFNCIDRSDAR